jgi:hypothetical protein
LRWLPLMMAIFMRAPGWFDCGAAAAGSLKWYSVRA